MSPAGSSNAPEARARQTIDRLLEEGGWEVQDRDDMNLLSARAVAVREFKLERGHGFADYILFLDGKAVGVCEAKPAGVPVRNVEMQARKYVDGLPRDLDAPFKPLPFTTEARKEATRDGVPPIELVDADRLVAMFERANLGLKPKQTYDVDESFFAEFAR